MKDAIVIFICFILIILFGFSVASWSLLTTKEQVIWPNATNRSSSNATVVVEGADGSWSWQLLRDVLNWGLWKVFGQVAEPYNDAVSGTDKNCSFYNCREITNRFVLVQKMTPMVQLFSYLQLASRWYPMYFFWMFLLRCLSESRTTIHVRFENNFLLQYVVKKFNVCKKKQMNYGDINGSGSFMKLKIRQYYLHRSTLYAI